MSTNLGAGHMGGSGRPPEAGWSVGACPLLFFFLKIIDIGDSVPCSSGNVYGTMYPHNQ